jgi:phosphinothricin acetyltransferase
MAEGHGHAVIDIFNHFISNSMAAYPEEPVSYDFFDRFLQMMQGYPAFVATVSPGRVVGFGFLRPFHHASTLRRTAEVTYFILPEFTKQGIGTALLNRLIEYAVPMGIDNLVASISSKNDDSIAFHRKNGFRECGRIERAGRKRSQDFDIVWMQRPIQVDSPSEFRANPCIA